MYNIISSKQSVKTIQKKFVETIKEINKTNLGIILTSNNKAQAVLLPYKLFDGLIETIDILSDRELVDEIDMTRSSNDGISLEEAIRKDPMFVKNNKHLYALSNKTAKTKKIEKVQKEYK